MKGSLNAFKALKELNLRTTSYPLIDHVTQGLEVMNFHECDSPTANRFRVDSPVFIGDYDYKAEESRSPSSESGSNTVAEKFRPRKMGRIMRAGNVIDFSARSGISKSSFQAPYMRESRSPKEGASQFGRAAALGALRKDAASAQKKGKKSPFLDFDFARNRASLISTPSQILRDPSLHRVHEASSPFGDLNSNFAPRSPVLHEIVRKVTARSPLDGGMPCDEEFKSAFVDCLEFVCDGNEQKRHDAYPRDEHEDEIILKVFPVEVARRYSPDFIRHMLRHMYLSRQSLAAALVYLDRAQALNGDTMSVCNKNVNSLVLSALILATRVIERRGYSDEILAMMSGMDDADSLRRTVSFFLEKLNGNAEVSAKETKPYEKLLDQLKPSKYSSLSMTEFEKAHIASRSRAVQMYYPSSACLK